MPEICRTAAVGNRERSAKTGFRNTCGEAAMAKLDHTDRQILMLLQEDDRQPLAALSE